MSGPSAEEPVRPDIVGFLRARIAEDDAVAREAEGTEWQPHARNRVSDIHAAGVIGTLHPTAEHIARHDPARVLREVEAKRRLLDHYEGYVRVRDQAQDPRVRSELDRHVQSLLLVVEFFAAVHDQHPDYDPAWRPS